MHVEAGLVVVTYYISLAKEKKKQGCQ